MKEIYPQYKKGVLFLSDLDISELDKEYKENQPLKCKVTGVGLKMVPSIEQHRTLFKCFSLLAGNNEHPSLQNTEAVKEASKIGIDHRDLSFMVVRPDGGIQLRYLSYGFKGLPPSKNRDIIIQKAFEWTASMLGMTVEDMVEEAKSQMGPSRAFVP